MIKGNSFFWLLLLLLSTATLSACNTSSGNLVEEAQVASPSLPETDLTRTATVTSTVPPTESPSPTHTPSDTPAPTATATQTNTPTPTPTPFGGGGEIVFASNQDGDYEIFLIDPAGEQQRKLTDNDVDDMEPSWSSDGAQLVYVSSTDGNLGIYILGLDQPDSHLVLDLQGNVGGSPSWTDDDRIFYWGQSSTGTNNHYFSTDISGQEISEFPTFNKRNTAIEPTFSNASRQLTLLLRMTEEGNTAIHGRTPQGESIWFIPVMRNVRDVSWSPDGSRLAFSSKEAGTADIYTADLSTGEVELLIAGDQEDRYPSWSPDGTRLVFASNREGSWDLFSAAATGDDIQRLTTDPGDEIDPEWFVPHISGNHEMEVSAKAVGMFEQVQEIYELGWIDSTKGQYQSMVDTSIVAEGRNSYVWQTFWPALDRFIIRSNVSWEMMDENANWQTSGCGFVFRQQDDMNHAAMYVGLDRVLYLGGVVDGIFHKAGNDLKLNQDFIVPGLTRPSGSAELILGVQEGGSFTFVNGEFVGSTSDWNNQHGGLSLAAFSGTNQDGGITCTWSNIEIWELE